MYFRLIRIKKFVCGFINWCCFNRKKRLNKKELIMVYFFRENVFLFVFLIFLVLFFNEDKIGILEIKNNYIILD